jgi:sarcosine oxidase subunit alpha
MNNAACVIVGAGPAGLSAAYELLKAGAPVTLIERSHVLGGQLSKQTHKFFGSETQFASLRGLTIMETLIERLKPYQDRLTLHEQTQVVGLYSDKVLTCVKDDIYFKIQATTLIVATGASEKALPFEQNDLPGVYAAGAVQTLMNQYGVKPGRRVLMVGSGNIGLIVAYQLRQAGVEVAAIVEASDRISGYLVHASKCRRLGIPILTQHSIKAALGESHVNGAVVWQLDEHWQGLPGSEVTYDVDTICLAVGLAPLSDLLLQVGVKSRFVNELGGVVPWVDAHGQTSLEGVYACGDVTGIEEASSAMVEGALVALRCLEYLGIPVADGDARRKEFQTQLHHLRHGPHAAKLRTGYAKRGDFSV